MSQISPILRETDQNGLMFWCPGCDAPHRVQHGAGTGPRWTWNGDVNRPTFSPSILVRWSQWEPPATTPEISAAILRGEIQQSARKCVCHSFVRDGQIQFLEDCTHALAGQTVALMAWDDA